MIEYYPTPTQVKVELYLNKIPINRQFPAGGICSAVKKAGFIALLESEGSRESMFYQEVLLTNASVTEAVRAVGYGMWPGL